MTKDETLRLALEFVEGNHAGGPDAFELINTIKQALEQPDEEPVAWGVDWGKAGDSPCVSIIKRLPGGGIEVVAVEYGPKREWQGLTGEERYDILSKSTNKNKAAARVEAKLKEKNDVS